MSVLRLYYQSMKQSQRDEFEALLNKFADSIKNKKLSKRSQELYLMSSFKISNVCPGEAIRSYFRLAEKYETGELKVLTDDWHKNQRKLFIWFLICFCEEHKILIQNLSEADWAYMSKVFFKKSPFFLKFQGLNIIKNNKRHIWTEQDDTLLKKHVEQVGPNQWNTVSKAIFFQKEGGKFISPKQCRERWFNHIFSQINKNEWSHQEDTKLLKMALDVGKKWSIIARALGSKRTEHMVKNRYNSIINKVRRKRLEKEENLAKRALSILQRDESSASQIFQQRSKKVKKTKKMSPIQSDEQDQNQNSDIKTENKINIMRVKRAISREISQNGEQYNVNNLPEGQLNILKGFLNKREKGFIAFNADDALNQNEFNETLAFSMNTPSVKAISPGFTSHFYNFQNFFRPHENRRDDGSSLFSPAPCYSPYLPSFSPGYDALLLKHHTRSNKEEDHRFSVIQNSKQLSMPSSELSCEYKNIVSSTKKEE